MNQNEMQHENIIAGIVGALLFSLAGGVIYFALYEFGFICSIAGLVGVVLAIKGYSLFAKKESKKGVIIASIISLAVIAAAWYLSIAFDIWRSYDEAFEEGIVDFRLSFPEAVQVVPQFLQDPEIGPQLLKDLAMTILFTLIGSVSTIINTIRNLKKKEAMPKSLAEAAMAGQDKELTETEGSRPADTAILRSAQTDEKVKIFTEADAWGHHVVFRKVGKGMEELVIDNAVYAEHKMGTFSKAYSMSAIVDGHYFTVGMYQQNYIEVDGVRLATSIRWI